MLMSSFFKYQLLIDKYMIYSYEPTMKEKKDFITIILIISISG